MQTIKTAILLLVVTFCYTQKADAQDFGIQNITNQKVEAINQYWDIAKDNRGIMYFANPKGVYEYDGLSWRLIKLPKKAGVYSLLKSAKGRIYVGGRGQIGYLAPNRKGEMLYVSLNAKLPEKYKNFGLKIINIEHTKNEIIFFCDNFLLVYTPEKENIYSIPAFSYFYSIVCVQNKVFVVDEEKGLLFLKNKKLQKVLGGENIISYFMMPNAPNIVIFSPNAGLLLYNTEEKSFEQLNSDLKKYDIKSGQVLANGNFAFGSVSNGCIFTSAHGKELYNINQEKGILADAIYSLQQTSDGEIWLGLSNGISLLYPKNEKKRNTQDSSSIFRVNIRSCNRRKDESLIFGGAFAKINDSVQSLVQPAEQRFRFKYFDNSFRFTFAATQYHGTSNFTYQYFMDGFDQQWTSWTDRPYSEYTNLGSGDFILKVRAKNEKGEISNIGEYTLYIEIPWYESWWFFAAQVAFLFALLTISIFMYRAGKSEKIAGAIISIVVVVVFEYAENLISPVFQYLAIGVALTMFVSSVAVAIVMSPAEKAATKLLKKVVRRKGDKQSDVHL